MSEAAQPKLRLQNVAKSFGDKIVLDGTNLSIMRGESLVLMGASGGGKSVLAKCALGLMPIDGGSVWVDGIEMAQMSEGGREQFMQRVGVLFQHGALFDSLTICQNVAFGLVEGRGMTPSVAREIALQKMALVGLEADIEQLLPAELSGGMRKRVALARAIATDPELLVLDEPVEGLDPIMAAIVANVVAETARTLGATLFSITNSLACARRLATWIALLRDGRIVWQGTPRDMDLSQDSYVKKFARYG